VFIAEVIRSLGAEMKFLVTVIGENHAEQMALECLETPVTPEHCRRLELAGIKFNEILQNVPADVCPEYDYALYEAQQAKYQRILRETDVEPECMGLFDSYCLCDIFPLKQREAGKIVKVASARKGEIDWDLYCNEMAEFRLSRWYKAWAESGSDAAGAAHRLRFFGIHEGETCDEYISWCDALPGVAICQDDVWIDDQVFDDHCTCGSPHTGGAITSVEQHPLWDRYKCYVRRSLPDTALISCYSCHS